MPSEKNFSGPPPVFIPPMKAMDIREEWCADVRKIIQRDGYAVRSNGDFVIEVKSLTSNNWHPLGLPNGSGKLASREDRDIVLQKIVGK